MIDLERPWLHDDLDAWIKRQQQVPYKCAIIFLDNSGCDVVLGIIPFARELLRRGTRVRLIFRDTLFCLRVYIIYEVVYIYGTLYAHIIIVNFCMSVCRSDCHKSIYCGRAP